MEVTAGTATGTDLNVQAIRENVRGSKGWLKFLGILSIIQGAFAALSIVGIIFAWMPIWLGVLMVKAGGRAGEYAERGDPASLAAYTKQLSTLFKIMGIVTIISLALGLIGGIIGMAIGIFGANGGFQTMLQDYMPGN
jgi:hypothetical protein